MSGTDLAYGAISAMRWPRMGARAVSEILPRDPEKRGQFGTGEQGIRGGVQGEALFLPRGP
eukprot:1950883-Rhodomonas_salina.1